MTINQIAIIGASASGCSPELYAFCESLGQALAAYGKTVVNGGRDGTMEAVFKGMQASAAHRPGQCVGITPHQTTEGSNPYCDVIIPTGLGYTRNSIVASSGDVVIAIGGSSGTLSEMAFAWTWGKPMMGLVGFGGWSEQLAGTCIDSRRPDDVVVPVRTVDEIIAQLKAWEAQP